jgi:hypothetical protein
VGRAHYRHAVAVDRGGSVRPSRCTRYDDTLEYEGVSISVLRHTGYTNVINISLQAR